MVEVILASQSAIRKKMMEESKIPFEVIVSDADETPDYSKSFQDQLKEISMRKAQTVFDMTTNRGKRVIVAADMNMFFDGVMYGKPKTIDEARKLIKRMMGRKDIYGYCGNSLIYADGRKILKVVNEFDSAKMSMDKISDKELEEYLRDKNPLSKCGGVNPCDASFLHLEEGRMSTASGMTIEYLQELLSSL